MYTCEKRRWISVEEGRDQAVEVCAGGGHDDLLQRPDGASAVRSVEAMPVHVQVGDDA